MVLGGSLHWIFQLVEYRKNGILPYYHIGGRILYKESDVERIMQENFYDVFGKK